MGQDHVAGDQDPRGAPGAPGRRRARARRRRAGVRAVQAHVVGRVALPEDHPPGVVARRDGVALVERGEVGRQPRLEDLELGLVLDQELPCLRRQPVPGQPGRGGPRVRALLQAPQHQPRLVGQAAHQELGPVLLAQPVGQAAMVGMMVGHEDAGATAAAVAPARHLPQERAGPLVPHPGVDDGQAVAVLQHPDVDVVELEGQRQPHPVDAGQYLQRLAGGRRPGERISVSATRARR